jgi:hypothetical protein
LADEGFVNAEMVILVYVACSFMQNCRLASGETIKFLLYYVYNTPSVVHKSIFWTIHPFFYMHTNTRTYCPPFQLIKDGRINCYQMIINPFTSDDDDAGGGENENGRGGEDENNDNDANDDNNNNNDEDDDEEDGRRSGGRVFGNSIACPANIKSCYKYVCEGKSSQKI